MHHNTHLLETLHMNFFVNMEFDVYLILELTTYKFKTDCTFPFGDSLLCLQSCCTHINQKALPHMHRAFHNIILYVYWKSTWAY